MPTRGDRHLRAIQLAKQLAALGARLKTIHLITGIPPRQVQSLFFPDPRSIPRGRAPDSAEWYHGANLILRSDACLIGARYRQLRNQGLAAGEALMVEYLRCHPGCGRRGETRRLRSVGNYGGNANRQATVSNRLEQ